MPGASLALFADLGACHVQKSSVTICVLPAPFRWRATGTGMSMQTAVQISIHALRVEGDHLPLSFLHTVLYFYPRPPGWRATTVGRIACAFEQFLSTPSGWRATSSRVLCSQVHFFSIHALRVEGDPPGAAGGSASKRGFLSTPSGWRATAIVRSPIPDFPISIHALRVEGDIFRHVCRATLIRISIHALRVEGDWYTPSEAC